MCIKCKCMKKFLNFLRSIFCSKPVEQMEIPQEHVCKVEEQKCCEYAINLSKATDVTKEPKVAKPKKKRAPRKKKIEQ